MEFIEKLRKLPGFTQLVAIAYLRISTDREEVYSIEEQQFDIQEFADKWGIRIIDWVPDRGLSGGTFEKRNIAAIIERIRVHEKGANMVLVALRNRWGREPDLNRAYERELQAAGGVLVAARNMVDPTTAAGRTQIHTDDFISGLQRHQIGDHWQNTVKRRRRNGLPHTAAERFGYKICPDCTIHEQTLENGKVRRRVIKKCGECGGVHVIDETRAPALAEFYERWVGGRSARKLAIEMRERGIRSVRGNVMTANQWLDVCDTGYAAGYLRSRSVPRNGRGMSVKYANDRPDSFDVWEKGLHKKIISEELWQAYRRKRAKAGSKNEKSESATKYPMSGWMRCGRPIEDADGNPTDKLCLRPMTSRGEFLSANPSTTLVDLYGCEGVKHKECKGISIDKKRAEKLFVEWLETQALDDSAGREALEQASKAQKASNEAGTVRRDIEAIHAKMSRLLDNKDSGEIHPVMYKVKEQELLASLAPLETRLEILEQKAKRTVTAPTRKEFLALAKAWPRMSSEEKQSLARDVVSHAVVYKIPGKRGNMLRVVPLWSPEAGELETESA